jgi:outer membrane protein assembly factor BamB
MMKCFSILGVWGGLALAAAGAENWPEFRGPAGNGSVAAARLPQHWSETNNIAWKTALHGRAWSSPVIWGAQVWLTTATEDGRQLYAVGVDRATGRIRQDRLLFEVARPQFAHAFNTYASPTPAIEEGRVYVTFGSPGTACLDTASGQVLWQRRDFECNHWRGAGSSPILYQDRLFLHFDGADFQYLVALDKATGRTLWKVNRSINYQDLGDDGQPKDGGDWRKAFSTPVLAHYGGQAQLISLGSKALYAYDPATGAEHWRVENHNCHSGSARPVLGEDLIYYCGGFPKGELWAVRPGGQGDVSATHVAWRNKKDVPSKPSVVLAEGCVFMVDDNGVASAVEARTGETLWRQRLGGHFSASPSLHQGRIYVFSEEGKTTVFEAARQYRELAVNQLGDGFMASPAVAGEAWFLRSRTMLYRVEERMAEK